MDVIKYTEDCVERVSDDGTTLSLSSSAGVSMENHLGLRIPGLRRVGLVGFLELLEGGQGRPNHPPG